jgi:uncharacterized protein YerC
MAQVSRLPLSKALETHMFQLFRSVLADLHTDDEIDDFLQDLLTPTEKIMLGKRLAIAFLLDRGYDQRSVHTIMKVSVTTVSSVNRWFLHSGKGYKHVIEKMRKAQKWQAFVENIDLRLRDALTKKSLRQIVNGSMYHQSHDSPF